MVKRNSHRSKKKKKPKRKAKAWKRDEKYGIEYAEYPMMDQDIM